MIKRLLWAISGFLLLGSTGVVASSFPYASSEEFLSSYAEGVQAANGERHVVRVSREAVALAVSTGQLAIPLPTGDVVVARYERDYTNDRDDWTFVGKVDTAVGGQSVVITFGTDGVFGVIPSPSGDLLQLQSGAGGQAWVEPIDDLIPPVAERKSFAPARLGESATHDHSQCYVIPATPKAAGDRKPLTDEQAEAIAKTGTVVIDVLGIYTTGVIEERGSAAAAETYFHSLVELSNQAFVDSGIDARYRVVGLRRVPEPTGRFNSQVIGDLERNQVPGIDVIAEREAVGADLVSMLRRFQNGDPTCGIAALNGAGLKGSEVVDGSPYSVNACGGYVMAHEFGHNLGSQHDIETTFGSGLGGGSDFGAYPYSFGHRSPGRFHSIMAYFKDSVALSRFSNPRSTQCLGLSCGVEDLADNARSLALMAPRIAGFRAPNSGYALVASARSTAVNEGNLGNTNAVVGVLLSSPAPAGGAAVQWETADGTAVAGWDYRPSSGVLLIPQGALFGAIQIPVLGDVLVESDETFRVRLSSAGAFGLNQDEITVVIKDDDPGAGISGTMRFPPDIGAPSGNVTLSLIGQTPEGDLIQDSQSLSPPNYAYAFRVPLGSTVNFFSDLPLPYAELTRLGVSVDRDREIDLVVREARTISGRLVFPDGRAPQVAQRIERNVDWGVFSNPKSLLAQPPEFRFEFPVTDGDQAWLLVRPSGGATFKDQHRVLGTVTSNIFVDVPISDRSTIGFTRPGLVLVEGETSCAVGLDRSSAAETRDEVRFEFLFGPAASMSELTVSGSPPDRFVVEPGMARSSNLCIRANPDASQEQAETVILRLQTTGAVDLTKGGEELVITIVDAPPRVPSEAFELTVGDAARAEGQAGQSEVLVPVTFSRPVPSGGLRLRLSTADRTTVAGQDYQAKTLFWDLPPGLTSTVFGVPVLGDRTDEPDETFVVRVSDVASNSPVRIVNGEAVVTIRNDDATPRLRLLDAEVLEGDSGAQPLALRVALSHPAASTVTGTWSTGGGTATAGSDYTAASGSFSIPAGQSTTTLAVEVLGDTAVESNETFNVTVGGVVGAVIDDGTAVVTITNDDVAGSPNLRIGDVSLAEGNSGRTAFVFPVTLSSPAGTAGVAFDVATVAQSAQAGSDFDALATQRVTIASGASSASIRVDVLGDTDVEADESVGLSISNVSGATLRTIAPRAIIRNDDARVPEPQLVAPADVSVTEGNSGTQTVRLAWTLSSPAPAGGVTFDVATVDGTAKAGEDYVALSMPVRIEPGQTRAEVEVQVNGDTTGELDESLDLAVGNLKGAVFPPRFPVLRILNDDPRNRLFGRVVSDEGVYLNEEVLLRVNDESSDQYRQIRPRYPDYVYEVLISHDSPVYLIVDAGFRAPAYPDTSVMEVGSVRGDVRKDVEMRKGFVARGRVLFPEGAVPPQFLSVQSQAIGRRQFFNAGGQPGYVFEASLRPGVSNCIGAMVQPPLVSECEDLGVVTGDVERDIKVYFSQAITFGTAPTVVVGGTGVVSATASSGLPVSLSSQTAEVCTVSGSTVTGVSAGTCTIAANQSGNASFLAAPQVTQSFAVVALPPLEAEDDRVLLAENSAGVDVAVLGNDRFVASRLSGGSLTIVRQPGNGSASVLTGADAASAADDQIRFVPARNWSGSDSLRYRLCEGGSQPRCAEATVFVEVRPIGGGLLELEVSTNRGFREVPLSGLRALPGVQFAATSLSAPVVGDLPLGVDPTPETPWDNGRAGTAHVSGSLAGRSDAALPWQVFAEAAGSGDVDLYLGEDLNGDGQPSESELRCTSAMSAAGERCELALTVAAGGTGRYWAMVHNRGSSAQTGRLSRYEVPLLASDGSLVTTAPGILAAGESFPLRVQWDDPTLLGGESRVGYVQMILGGATQAVFPVKLTRTAEESTPLALESGVDRTLRIAGNGSHEQLFIDVPAGATRLLVTTTSGSNVDVYLARVAPPSAGSAVPAIGTAPPRNQAQASGTTPGGNESVEVLNPAAGRWYVTPVNMTGSAITVTVRATVSGTAPTVRAGGYFNTGRSGHGLFIYPAGGVWAGIWYTYREDRTPTWYYLQGDAPGANGIWQGEIYRATLVGGSRFLTVVGQGTATPTGPDAFTFSYTLDGQMGSEPFSGFGRGCPNLGGRVVDASGHWFDPTRTGTGYSVQLLPNYEFYALFLYTARGEPIFLTAERPGVGQANDTVPVQQLRGFCPLCARGGDPERSTVGVLRREFVDGRLSRMNVDVRFTDGVTGTWVTDDAVIPLGGLQGCQAN